MTTAYDPYGAPDQRRQPADPLLSLPDHPSGEWATTPDNPPRIGHPRPARHGAPYLPSVASVASDDAYPVVAQSAGDPSAAGGQGRARLLTMLIVLVLVVVAGWQAYRLDRVDRDGDRVAAVLTAERAKAAQLTDRTNQLEKQLAGVFDPEAISSAVLPSVFRVRAGNFTGTAFSVGDKASGGKANLLTNFHVVESVWNAGGRKVSLERGKNQLSATIIKVSKGKDLALLRATKQIAGLSAAPDAVKPGQQIMVVGAPLGLDDSVTTGVVSAVRQDGAGPTIQFDAPINPGNSGGPVVNASDDVVGLATAKARDAEGIGLAIPIKTACDTFGVC
jgi:putative serine protease PepD